MLNKWKLKKVKKKLIENLPKTNEKTCNHDKCILKASVNGFCIECIQLPSKECNFCVTNEMVKNKFPELVN